MTQAQTAGRPVELPRLPGSFHPVTLPAEEAREGIPLIWSWLNQGSRGPSGADLGIPGGRVPDGPAFHSFFVDPAGTGPTPGETRRLPKRFEFGEIYLAKNI